MTSVIAIAAPFGGEGAALVEAFTRALGNAPTLHFDDFEEAKKMAST